MDFWIDIAVAVILRLMKDRREREKYTLALMKVYNTIGRGLNSRHIDWTLEESDVQP